MFADVAKLSVICRDVCQSCHHSVPLSVIPSSGGNKVGDQWQKQVLELNAHCRNLAVIGGGQMGTGIAQVAAIAGQQVSKDVYFLQVKPNLIN